MVGGGCGSERGSRLNGSQAACADLYVPSQLYSGTIVGRAVVGCQADCCAQDACRDRLAPSYDEAAADQGLTLHLHGHSLGHVRYATTLPFMVGPNNSTIHILHSQAAPLLAQLAQMLQSIRRG